jgi:glycine oxidase
MTASDVIIAGAGIIGLSTALELAAKGIKVTVLERQSAMSEASWAAAGMLAAHDPENPPQLQPLSNLSISLYPEFLAKIEHLSGFRVPLRTSGTLQESSQSKKTLSQNEIAGRVPALNSAVRQFIWLEEHSLDPRDLCAALPQAAKAAGVHIQENSPVTEVHTAPSGIEAVTPNATYSARHFVNCCGAWAGTIANHPAIGPRKGQMVVVNLPSNLRLDCVIRTPELYLVPRGDGRVVIGASVEQAGFDKTVRETTIQELLRQAASLWPPVREAKIVETWAGLRPGSSDGLPVIDASGEQNCWIASGHFRNGILLAPGTARILRQLIFQEPVSIDLSPFHCDRFTEAVVS